MRVTRAYCDTPLGNHSEVTLEGELAHYLSRVLRLKPGNPVHLFNEQEGEFSAVVTGISRRTLTVSVTAPVASSANPTFPIHLALGLSRGDRMDYAIQKSTEVGVTSITPLLSDFSEVRLTDNRLVNKLAHWRKVAISACEQCGRTRVPRINEPVPLQPWLDAAGPGLRILPDHRGSAALAQSARPEAANLLIGPEGGFSEGEVALAVKAGFNRVRLGPRVLRTETAPIVAISLLQCLYGDFRQEV
ncbi:MAG: 16S rRNA (uracil(1498)-N(3))-methyltransferase [Pseudohongiellaceae bacterium]